MDRIAAHADIIVFALIAVVLLARLWTVFGRRNGEDRQRPNPFVTPAPDAQSPVVRPGFRRADNPGAPLAPLLAAPMSLAGALERVRQADPSFDEKPFLQNARETFSAIVGAFAKGDLAGVEDRLGPAVLPHFQAALAARREAGETLESRIARIRDTEVTAAQVEDGRAFVTVRFVSEQENIWRDAAGKIVGGAPGRTEEIVDLWVFARDVKSSDPGWRVVETKS